MSVLENLSNFEYLDFTLSAKYELFPNLTIQHRNGNVALYNNIVCASRLELKTTPVEFYNNDAFKQIILTFKKPLKYTRCIGGICNIHTNTESKGYDNISVPFNISGYNNRIELYSGDAIGKTNSPPELIVDILIVDFIAIFI